MAFPWMAAATGFGVLGSLFARDPAKSQLAAQKDLLRMQWQREDQQRPYRNSVFHNPQFQQQLRLGQNNNLMNWGAFAPRMTPEMLQLLETAAPQYRQPQKLHMMPKVEGMQSPMQPIGPGRESPWNRFSMGQMRQ